MNRTLVVLAIMIFFALSILTACSTGSNIQINAYDYYTELCLALENPTSLQGKINNKVNVKTDDKDIDVINFTDATQIIHSENDIKMFSNTSSYVSGFGKNEATICIKDGWFYKEDAMGIKSKRAFQIGENNKVVRVDELLPFQFDKSAIINSSVKNMADGKQLHFALKGSKICDILKERVVDGLNLSGGMRIDGIFSDVDYTVLLDSDNMPKEMHIIFYMETEVDGKGAVASYNMDVADLVYNKTSKIDYPPDPDEYIEM